MLILYLFEGLRGLHYIGNYIYRTIISRTIKSLQKKTSPLLLLYLGQLNIKFFRELFYYTPSVHFIWKQHHLYIPHVQNASSGLPFSPDEQKIPK